MIQQLATMPKHSPGRSSRRPEDESDPAPRARTSLANRVLRLVRRVHLYSGLFLFPWVILYGVTGYLFNHPRVFSDQTEIRFGAAEIEGTRLAGLPRPAAVAEQVVAAIVSAQRQQGRSERIELIEPASARFSRGQALVSFSADAKRYSVMVDLDDGTGGVRTRPETQPASAGQAAAPFAERDIRLEEGLDERLRSGVATVLQKMGHPVDEAASVATPELLFKVMADGKPYQVSYSPDRASLVAREAGQPLTSLTTRSFLTRLHLIHGYPSSFSARWFWAAVVDAMFVAMCFWGVSGILMWWQLKATRMWGAGCLAASVVVAASMTLGMHQEMQATPMGMKGGDGPPGVARERRGAEAPRPEHKGGERH